MAAGPLASQLFSLGQNGKRRLSSRARLLCFRTLARCGPGSSKILQKVYLRQREGRILTVIPESAEKADRECEFVFQCDHRGLDRINARSAP